MKRVALLLGVAALQAVMARAPRAPAQVAVVGNDYAFIGFPSTIAAGPTAFSFENRGEVRHEMTIILLKPGLTVKDIMAMPTGAITSPRAAESLIGLLIARKHEKAGGQLLVELKSGQRYLVICNLRDAPDGPPHSTLGMVTSFDVP
jgi:hypothetical protein